MVYKLTINILSTDIRINETNKMILLVNWITL